MNAPQHETARCPYCDEEIRAKAKKCKHCGEWLDVSATSRPVAAVAGTPEKVEWETIQIDVRQAGIAGKASVVNTLIPGSSGHAILVGEIIGHVQSPAGGGVMELAQFSYDAGANSIDELWSLDRQRAQDILDGILAIFTESGFEITDRGTQWYSYRIRRRWNHANESLVTAWKRAEVNTQLSFQNQKTKTRSWISSCILPLIIVIVLVWLLIYIF